jgi:nucleotide-binding universal stress UspA family protein
MTYPTLMVRVELGSSNSHLLKVAASFAERFHSDVVGVATCQPIQFIYGENYYAADIVEQDRVELDREIGAAEAEFYDAFKSHTKKVEWRSSVIFAPLANYVASEARNVDLILTGPSPRGAGFVGYNQLNLGDLVMQAGRPVLVVPPSVETPMLRHAVVGWKNTRECRRAIADAVPMLRAAARVTLMSVCPDDARDAARRELDDVTVWLKRHGITAHSAIIPSTSDDASRFGGFAVDQRADVIVAGAYGHSRLREWVLGGVTRDLLLCPDRCAFLSH